MRPAPLKRWLTSLPIRTQLALLVALVVAPMVGLLVWSGLKERREAVARAQVQTQRLADSLVAEQQAVVAAAQQLFFVLAQLPEVRARDPRVQPLLVELLRLNPDFINLVLVDLDGSMWAQAAGVPGVNLADRRYFRNALATGRVSSGEFTISRSQGRPIFNLGYPVRDDRGALTGVVGVALSLDGLRSILKRAQLPAGASYALLDHAGIVLARGIDQDRFLGKPYDRARFEAMVAGPDAQSAIEPGLDEKVRVAAFRKLRLPGEAGPYMYVRAGIPLEVVLREANLALARNLAISLALLALAVAAAMLVGNRAFVARISVLESASRRLAGGEPAVRVSGLVEGGELGSLARSFDQMAAQLEARQLALGDSEQRYREIFDATLDGIMLHDAATGQILDANRVAEALYGRSKAELLGCTADDLSAAEPPWTSAEAAERLRRARSEGPQTFEWRARRRGGELFWAEVRLAATTLGGEGRILATIRDVTARKAAEDERQTLQERLLQAQKLESVGRLAGGVAHDINNMLAVILGEVELLQGDLPPGHPAHRAASEIRSAGQRSRDIARQLLAFSRKQVIRPRPVEPDAAVTQTLQTLSRLVGEEYALEFAPGAGGWQVRVDPVQLDQVLFNLVVNARDATPGGGRIRIATSQVVLDAAGCRGLPGRHPGEFVRLSVADDGVGMDAETLAHVFEPFFTRKDVGAGTGLGLATVYGIASQNGGFVDVTSEPGRGATFDVHLPRSLPAAADAAPAGDAPAQPAAHHGPGAAGTVLLVEDEELVRRTALRMLESLGYAVLTAAAPEEALALAGAPDRHLDLLLTDVVMPGMKGPELARRLTALRPGLRVIFMSGHTAGDALSGGGAEGAAGFLQKPFTRADLAARLAEALARPTA